jgi:hypothetical protein
MSAATRWIRIAGTGLALAGAVAGCTSASMPKLPSLASLSVLPAAPETGSAPAAAAAASGPVETSLTVAGTPTGVFTQVAHGALRCWFGANGPLKADYVYRAEAEPPSKGGAAEIVIHERDTSFRDQRGPRAYRVTFDAQGSGVHVTSTALKVEPAKAQAMARDVETWARGGNGCQLGALFPPPAPPARAKVAKAAAKGGGQSRKR